jgi:hypothetical protein
MGKLSFSGHESFICKQFWLKKVFDYAAAKKNFNDETAVIDLGVGKNMVASLRFWGRAFGILNEDDSPTLIAQYLFSNKGKDQYLEDLGTVWLLHYHLIKNNRSSIYSLVFNEFRKERIDFTKEQLHQFLKRRCEELYPIAYNTNTITSDINVFLRNYLKPQKDEKIEIEEDFAGVLIDLDLVRVYKQRDDNDKIVHWYKIEAQDRIDLPWQIVFYSILDNYSEHKSISFRELLSGRNSPGVIFALTADGLYNQLQKITQNYNTVIYTETAGNQVLQFKTTIKSQKILDEYYG